MEIYDMTLEQYNEWKKSEEFEENSYPMASCPKCLGENNQFDEEYWEIYWDMMDREDVFESLFKVDYATREQMLEEYFGNEADLIAELYNLAYNNPSIPEGQIMNMLATIMNHF